MPKHVKADASVPHRQLKAHLGHVGRASTDMVLLELELLLHDLQTLEYLLLLLLVLEQVLRRMVV